jgi:hypothetical protein
MFSTVTEPGKPYLPKYPILRTTRKVRREIDYQDLSWNSVSLNYGESSSTNPENTM